MALPLMLCVYRPSFCAISVFFSALIPAPEGDMKNWLDEAILVNPKIVASGKGKITAEEGCLSFPGMEGKVRPPLLT